MEDYNNICILYRKNKLIAAYQVIAVKKITDKESGFTNRSILTNVNASKILNTGMVWMLSIFLRDRVVTAVDV